MLEFDETNDHKEPRGELKPLNEGYVVLPVSEYNELLRRADAAYNALTLSRRDYHKHKPIEATIDKHWLYQLATAKLCMEYSADELKGYEVTRSADDLIVLDFAMAKLAEPTEEG